MANPVLTPAAARARPEPIGPLRDVATASGFASVDTLRRHLRAHLGPMYTDNRRGNQPDERTGSFDVDRQAAFTALFDAHYVTILRYVERRVSDDQLAQDITADVFETLWHKLDVDDPQDIRWLYVVAQRLMGNHHRRSGRRASAEAALLRAAEEPAVGVDIEDRLALTAAIDRLDERERRAIELTYWDGMSAEQTGSVLGMSRGAVWTLLSRVRDRLRRELGATDETREPDEPDEREARHHR